MIAPGRIDVVDTWTTDGKLLRCDIRIPEDDSACFAPCDAAPIVRGEELESMPGLEALVARLAFRIDDERMRHLDYRVEEEGGTFEEVARDFLREEGLLDPDDTAPATVGHTGGLAARRPRRRTRTARSRLRTTAP